MKILDWPPKERPREKLLQKGVTTLTEAELLAIFLRTGTKGKSAIDLARELLRQYQTLRNILNLPPATLMKTKGIGKAKLSMLQATLELATRCLEEQLRTPIIITQPETAKKFFIAKLGNARNEIFSCLFLDAKHQVIKFEELFTGSINYTPIYPRVVAQKALEYNAQAVIFAHNHPSNNVTPSQTDLDSTYELTKILKVLDISVLDHIIVGGTDCCSFAELGLL